MPGCIRNAVSSFRRQRFGADVCPKPGEKDQELFGTVAWMEMGGHGLDLPPMLCMGRHRSRIVCGRLSDLFGLSRDITIGPQQFCAVAVARFRFFCGKPVMRSPHILVGGSRPTVFDSSHTSDPIVRITSGENTLWMTRAVLDEKASPLSRVLKIEEDLRPRSDDTVAVIPRLHISRWDAYPGLLGLEIRGKADDVWKLGFAEAHTILTLEPEESECEQESASLVNVYPPLLVWIRRDGGHFEFPVLVGVIAPEDIA